MHFKKIELEPAIIWKVATCQKNTRIQWVDTWARDTVRRCWSADTLFWQLSTNQNSMYNIRLQAPKLARKCEIKHWYPCGADGRKVGWSVYGHVIAKFSRIDRFSKLWGFELSPWSNKLSAENLKKYLTLMGKKWAGNTVRWWGSVDTLVWQLSINLH